MVNLPRWLVFFSFFVGMKWKYPVAVLWIAFLLLKLPLYCQDWQSLHLKARFDTLNKAVIGETWQQVTQCKALDTLVLDAIRIQIDSLSINGQTPNFRQNDTAVFIPLTSGEDSIILYIAYQALPRKGIYFIGWQDSTRRSRRQIWTQGQGIDHRHWIPHNDDQRDKILFSAEWIFNKDFQVMSNGGLDSSYLEGSLKHWHFSMKAPMSSYLIAFAVDRYSLTKESINGIPHYLYHYPERQTDDHWYYYEHKLISSFLEEEIGIKYPWSNYKQAPVQDFRHGAMENTCATIFGDFFLVDSLAFPDYNYSYVNAHELAHQWFGNLVTAESSKHHWLHEGFATYYQWRSERKLYGYGKFQEDLEEAKQLVFQASRTSKIPLAHSNAGSERYYQKGGWLLHMLRNYIGDSIFQLSIRDYLQEHRYGIVRNEDFIAAVDQHSDKDIQGFFKLWLYEDREPIIDMKGLANDTLSFYASHYIPQGVQLDVLAKGVWRFVNSPVQKGLNRIPLPKGTTDAYIYNEYDLLLEVKEEVPWEAARQRKVHRSWDMAQAYALRHMVLEPDEELEVFLMSMIRNRHEYHSVKTIALEYLTQFLTVEELEGLVDDQLRITHDLDWQKALLDFALREDLVLEKALIHDYLQGASYKLRALAMRLLVKDGKPNDFRLLYAEHWRNHPGIRGRENYLESLYYRALFLSDKVALNLLLDFSSESFDFNTRINAIQYLANIKPSHQVYFDLCWNAFFNSNWKLVRVAKAELSRLQKEHPQRWTAYYKKHFDSRSGFQKRKAARTFEK